MSQTLDERMRVADAIATLLTDSLASELGDLKWLARQPEGVEIVVELSSAARFRAAVTSSRRSMAIITIPGSNLCWSTISEWVALSNARGQIVRACSGHYAQMDALYRSLTIERVRASHDNTGLAAARELLDNARNRSCGQFRGPERSLARAEIGALLVELHNRLSALVSGRWLLPRVKGPAFDPALLPDAALDRLIQTHPDPGVVERLRVERRTRQLAE